MEITITIKGESLAEIRETCKKIANQEPVEQAVHDNTRKPTIGGKVWSKDEKELACNMYHIYGNSWQEIAKVVNRVFGNNRTPEAVREYFKRLRAKEKN